MASSIIKFTHNATVYTAGYAIHNGVAGLSVLVENSNNAGVTSWEIRLLDVPVYPVASALVTGILASSGVVPPNPSATFIPDVAGSYRVQLTVNGTVISTNVVSIATERGWSNPPFDADDADLKYIGQTRGWAYNQDRILDDIRKTGNKADEIVDDLTLFIPGVAGTQINDGAAAAGYKGIGCIVVDPSNLPVGGGVSGIARQVLFRAVLQATAGVTGNVKLRNVDDAEDVTGTTLSTSALSPTRLVSAALTVGAAAGNLKNALRTYEVQIQITVPGVPAPGDAIICKLAQLEFIYN